MASKSPETLESFKRVYQSGHGDVYCDGKQHIYSYGGTAGIVPFLVKNFGRCDCELWKEIKGPAPSVG